MPKLSAVVAAQAGGAAQAQAAGVALPTTVAGQPLATTQLPPVLEAQAQPAQQQKQQQSSPGHQQGLEQQHGAAAAKLQADYAKRLREHGPRCYRWPDGSLRADRPPSNPYAVANRQQWAPLVQHCRTHGGDRGYERQGQSLRYGLGVPHQEHEAYLASIGLLPEADAKGQHAGEVPGVADPLADPKHCFNTYYKEGAEAVFKDKRGRLL